MPMASPSLCPIIKCMYICKQSRGTFRYYTCYKNAGNLAVVATCLDYAEISVMILWTLYLMLFADLLLQGLV